MDCLTARSHRLDTLRAIRGASDPEAQRILIAELPEELTSEVRSVELAPIIRRDRELPEPPPRARLNPDEWLGAFHIFGLVFFSTLPVVLPFLLVPQTALALRISNLVAVGSLFLTGYLFGRHIGHNPWRLGVIMVLIGSLLTAVAFFLGG